MLFGSRSAKPLPTPADALPGRGHRGFGVPTTHAVLGTPLEGPWPEGTEVLYIAMGCFWGAERIFWRLPGVVATAAGYMGGYTPNPTYEETCTGRTGHTEAVLVAYDPAKTSAGAAAQGVLGEPRPDDGQPPGQRRRHPVPVGDLLDDARAGGRRDGHPGGVPGTCSTATGFGADHAPRSARRAKPAPFYYAEDYHQQYLHKNPGGYCNHGPNGLTCPVGLLRQDQLPSQQDIVPGA